MEYEKEDALRRLRFCRSHEGLSQEKLAYKLYSQSSNTSVSRMETGGAGSDSISNWLMYAKFYNVDLEWLLFGSFKDAPRWYKEENFMENSMPKIYPSNYMRILDDDALCEKFWNQISEKAWDALVGNENGYGYKIFDNLEKGMPGAISDDDFYNPANDPFPGLEICSSFHPKVIRAALDQIGYTEEWLKETNKNLPYRENESLEDIINMHGYAGIAALEFPANFGYIIVIIHPLLSPEAGFCYIPFDSRDGSVNVEIVKVMALDGKNRVIGEIDGYQTDLFSLWTPDGRDIFGQFDSNTAEAGEEYFIMKKLTFPGEMNADEDEIIWTLPNNLEINPRDCGQYLYNESVVEYCFFCEDAWVLPEERGNRVFGGMMDVLRFLYGDYSSVCSLLSGLNEGNEKTTLSVLSRTLKIAKHYGMHIFDPKKEPGYNEYIVCDNENKLPSFAYYISPTVKSLWKI